MTHLFSASEDLIHFKISFTWFGSGAPSHARPARSKQKHHKRWLTLGWISECVSPLTMATVQGQIANLTGSHLVWRCSREQLSLSLSRYFIYVWKDYKLYGDNTCVLTFWWIHEYWPFRWLVAKNLVFLEVMIGAYLRASFSILIWQKQSNQIFWINQDAWEYPIKPICG